jgi:primosomal protein N' (replication factor Y) (superfamily II helicase)
MTRTGEAVEPTSVVQVRIDSQVPHLDRPFDYLVPASLTESVEVGSRVRVRFAGRLMTAYVVATDVTTDHPGELRPIERAMGPEPVLTDDTLKLVQAVAERWAGTFSDVVRSAVPPRHARAEKVNVSACTWRSDPGDSESGDAEPGEAEVGDAAWSDYGAGPALLRRLAESGSAEPIRAVWSLAPATDWSNDVAGLARAVTSMETGSVIVVVPDAADVDRVLAAIPEAVTARAVATLTADMGPERRYREFVRILRGGVRIVVGTRGSVFAPVPDLRLIVVWDDGDDSLVDPQAPYWNARDVAALRSHLSGCSLVVGSASRTVVTQQWCETGWAKSVVPSKETVSSRAPKVRAITEQDEARDPAAAAARMPHTAWVAARAGVADGPVLVQVARKGYVPALACQDCRTPARCSCGGPLMIRGRSGTPACSWCGAIHGSWSCSQCQGARLRAMAVGAERTVEEIGRAFPEVPVISSHGEHRLLTVGRDPAVVVATVGAEPVADGGYRAVLLLDARTHLSRPSLNAQEEAARRWFSAASLAAPGATVVISADNALSAVQALVRWDAPWLAARELQERESASLPPATRMAALVGSGEDIRSVAQRIRTPHRLLGPLPDPTRHDQDRQRGLVVVDRREGPSLSRELRAITATRSAESKGRPVHVHMDPRSI